MGFIRFTRCRIDVLGRTEVSSARAFVIGLSGFFIGPSIIGFLAEGTSISAAMAFPVISLLVAGFLSRVIK